MPSIASTSFDTATAETLAVTWAMGAGDTGVRANMAGFADRTVHAIGTFGSVTLRGSNLANPNDATAGDWFTLTDPQGTAITLTASGQGRLIAENPLWISPITTGGSGYTVTVVGVK